MHEELRRRLNDPSEALAILFEEYGWQRLVNVLTEQLAMRWKMAALAEHKVDESLWPALRELYSELAVVYYRHKRRHGALDFEDLEEEALNLLADPKCRDRLQKQYHHILVDEFQDISPPQSELIRLLHE